MSTGEPDQHLTDGKEVFSETPAEQAPKEEAPMADTDWKASAKAAGYALVPEADFEGYRADRESLKQLRSIFPEEARGKEGSFLKGLSERVNKLPELEDRVRTLDEVVAENTSLKTQNADLTRGKKLSDMWGHISRIQQVRNVRVHDRFIDEGKLIDFPLEKQDFSKPEGVEKFAEAVWKSILEPAYKEQTTVIEQVQGSRPRRSEDADGSRDKRQDSTDGLPTGDTPRGFGALA